MNNNSEGEESDTDSKDIINRGVPPSNIVAQLIPGQPVARLNLKNKFEYLIKKTRVIVGRSGGDVKQASQDVDVSIDSCSLYISRRHFDVFTNDCTTFYVSVYSKNGLFVNGSFVRRGSAAYPLKTPSRLRFPKTDTKIIFSTLERDPEENDVKKEMLSPVVVADNDLSNNSNSGNNGLINNHLENNKLPTNIQNYNTLLGQQQQQLQQLNVSSSSFHNNSNDNMKMSMLSPQSKLEREVYKHQQPPPPQQQQIPQPQQQIQIPINRKRKFTDTMDTGNQDWLSRGDYSDGRKPPFSYSQLIAQAIFSTSEHMLCLNDIYLYITKTYPFYRPEDKGWQNSIRHNLSLSKSFVRMPRANDEGKGSLWTIQPNDKQAMVKTAYRPRGTRDKYNALNHSHNTPNIFTPSKNSGMGDSEDSNEMYQNEDEEAANAISMSAHHQPMHDPFNYLPSSNAASTGPHPPEQFGDGDGDNQTKGGQSTILQSSFANPMQIFMQPPGRRNNNIVQQQPQQQQQIQLNNLSQLQRNNASGSLQVVRLSQLSNDNNNNTPSWQQQQQRQPQQIFIPQQQSQQIKLQQVGQASNTNNNQRIIIVRSAQQQQQTDGVVPAAKRIKLASPITFASPTTHSTPSDPPKQSIIITQQQMQQHILQQQPTVNKSSEQQANNNNQPLDFNSLPVAQKQQVLMQLQQQKKQAGNDDDVGGSNTNNNQDNNNNDDDDNGDDNDENKDLIDSDALTSVINENDDKDDDNYDDHHKPEEEPTNDDDDDDEDDDITHSNDNNDNNNNDDDIKDQVKTEDVEDEDDANQAKID